MRGCISGVFRRVDNAAPEAVGVQGVAMATANDLVKAVRHEDGSFLFSAGKGLFLQALAVNFSVLGQGHFLHLPQKSR